MNGLSLILLFGGFVLVSTELLGKPVYDLDETHIHFEEFINKFDKQYASEEEKQYRLSVFKENLKTINQNNEDNPYAVFAINKFSDLERDEFKKMYTGFVAGDGTNSCQEKHDDDVPSGQAPESFDWRDRNVITPVKNQGQCGSCWAFSTTGNIEAINAIKTGSLVSLSEKQLVDCNLENGGCEKGWMYIALSYVIDAGGIMSEQDYPYMPERQQCQMNNDKIAVKISGCNVYDLTDEGKLKDLLYSNGPLSIAVDATGWENYNSGIMSACGTKIDHAVLLVGYGEDNGIPFWIIKNSWGPEQNDNGYVRIKRGENMCGILNPYVTSAVI